MEALIKSNETEEVSSSAVAVETKTEAKTESGISRRDFLKKGMLGALGVFLVMRRPATASAAVVTDNLSGSTGGLHVGTSAPANTAKLWIDTSSGGRGVAKYYNGSSWSATASVWDE